MECKSTSDQDNILSELTIIIPHYCDAHRIRGMLKSIYSQSLRVAAVHVRDDGSPKEDVEILKKLQQEFGFELDVAPCNEGVQRTVISLLKKVYTPWVISCSADDRLCRGALEMLRDAIRKYPQAQVIFGDMERIFEDGTYLTTLSARPWLRPGFITPEQYMNLFLRKAPANFSLSGGMIHRPHNLIQITAPLNVFDKCVAWDTPRAWTLLLKYGGVYLGKAFVKTSVRQNVFEPEKAKASHGRMTLSQALSKQFLSIFVVIRQTAIFMKSPENAALFPKDFIWKWQIGYLYCAIIEWAKINIPYFSKALWLARKTRKKFM